MIELVKPELRHRRLGKLGGRRGVEASFTSTFFFLLPRHTAEAYAPQYTFNAVVFCEGRKEAQAAAGNAQNRRAGERKER